MGERRSGGAQQSKSVISGVWRQDRLVPAQLKHEEGRGYSFVVKKHIRLIAQLNVNT